MYARTSIVRFLPGTVDEATRIIQEVMLPGAQTQQGFKGAFLLKSDTEAEKYFIISLWETQTDLLASHPPEGIISLLKPLESYIADISQDICEVVFQLR